MSSAYERCRVSQRSVVGVGRSSRRADSSSTPSSLRTNESRQYCSSASRVTRSSASVRGGFWSGMVRAYGAGHDRAVNNVTVTVSSRFCGPPGSGNGGYTAGLLAEDLDGAVEVTLRRPPPLDRPFTVVRTVGRVELRDGDDLIAEAVPVALTVHAPPVVGWDDAVAASADSTF